MLMIISHYLNLLYKLSPRLGTKAVMKLFSKPFSPKKAKKPHSVFESAIHSEITCMGKTVACYQWGKGDNATLVIHGWGGRASNFETLIAMLVEQGNTVYAFDAPAHGNSTGKRTNVLEFKNAIIQLINKNSKIKNIVGHSLGGAAATIALKELENEQRSYRLILISSPADLAYVFGTFIDFLRLPEKAFKDGLAYIREKYGFDLSASSLINIQQPKNVTGTAIIHDKYDRIVNVSNSENMIACWNIDPKNVLITDSLGHYKILADTGVIKHIREVVSGPRVSCLKN